MKSPIDVATIALGAITFRDRPFRRIVDASAESGFDGIGLTVGQCVAALERGISLEDIRKVVDAAGMRIAEFELVRLCGVGPTQRLNDLVIGMVDTLNPDRVHTAAFRGTAEQISDDFAELCSRLPDHPVALEFMPYSAVSTFDKALRLVAESGQSNACVVLDIVHFFRSGGELEMLTPSAVANVACVQLSDVVDRGTVGLATEARHLRTYPGEGTLDVTGFLATLASSSLAIPPVSVEPISDALETLPLAVVAEHTMFSTLRALRAAGLARSGGRYVHGPSLT